MFKVDTGADVTVINHKTFSQISGQKLQPTTKKLISPAGNIKILGTVTANLTYKNKAIKEMLYVLDPTNKTGNLLSRKASVQLNIVKFIGSSSIKDDDIFGFGKWDTEPVKFHVKDNAVPYAVTAARNIAIPLYEPTKKALENLVKNDVIEPENHPTDWVSPMVPVAKASSKTEVRIIVDYKKLNANLKKRNFSNTNI